jgi:hypothetical protein
MGVDRFALRRMGSDTVCIVARSTHRLGSKTSLKWTPIEYTRAQNSLRNKEDGFGIRAHRSRTASHRSGLVSTAQNRLRIGSHRSAWAQKRVASHTNLHSQHSECIENPFHSLRMGSEPTCSTRMSQHTRVDSEGEELRLADDCSTQNQLRIGLQHSNSIGTAPHGITATLQHSEWDQNRVASISKAEFAQRENRHLELLCGTQVPTRTIDSHHPERTQDVLQHSERNLTWRLHPSPRRSMNSGSPRVGTGGVQGHSIACSSTQNERNQTALHMGNTE